MIKTPLAATWLKFARFVSCSHLNLSAIYLFDKSLVGAGGALVQILSMVCDRCQRFWAKCNRLCFAHILLRSLPLGACPTHGPVYGWSVRRVEPGAGADDTGVPGRADAWGGLRAGSLQYGQCAGSLCGRRGLGAWLSIYGIERGRVCLHWLSAVCRFPAEVSVEVLMPVVGRRGAYSRSVGITGARRAALA